MFIPEFFNIITFILSLSLLVSLLKALTFTQLLQEEQPVAGVLWETFLQEQLPSQPEMEEEDFRDCSKSQQDPVGVEASLWCPCMEILEITHGGVEGSIQ